MKKMNRLTENEARSTNGGGRYYWKVSGKTSDSQWTILTLIATRHIGAWTSNMYRLIMKVF